MSLNLFDIPDVDYQYKERLDVTYQSANTGLCPILFTVPASDDYFDLNESFLEVKVRLNTSGTGGVSDNESGASTENVSKYLYCVNNFAHSLFIQMNVSFNGVLMSEQTNNYHYKAFFETLLNYNRQGDSILASQGWVNELHVAEVLTPTDAATNDKPATNAWDGKTRTQKTEQPIA